MIMLSKWATANELITNISYNDAWRSTFHAIALEGLTISTSDKDVGIIQATGIFNRGSKHFTFPKLRGHIESHTLTLAATLRDSPDGVVININASGSAVSFVQRRSIMTDNVPKEYSETKCQSTGLLEKAILNRISITASQEAAP